MSTTNHFSELIALLTNKLSMVVITLSIVWCAIDMTSRLLPSSNSTNKGVAPFEIAKLYLPQFSLVEEGRLKESYQEHNVSTPSIENQGMSTTEQSKQNGLLDNLFINNNKLTLKAVIKTASTNSQSASQLKALIMVEDIKTGEQKIEKFSQQSSVYGYQLSIEKNTQVKLTKKQPQGLQEIILAMYKSISKTTTKQPDNNDKQ